MNFFKHKLFLLVVFTTSIIRAQNKVDPIVIEVNKTKYSQLIFPSEIIDKDSGHVAFQIVESTSDRSNAKIMKVFYAGTLDDHESNSNIQVETADGNIYDLPITNTKNPKQTTYLINSSHAVINILEHTNSSSKTNLQSKGNTVLKAKKSYTHYSDKSDVPGDPSDVNENSLYLRNKQEYYKNLCKVLINTKAQYSRYKSRAVVQNVELLIKGIYFDKNELYFVFNLKNNGGQAYDIKKWKFEKGPANQDDRKLEAPLEYNPEFDYNLKNRIEANSEMDFIIVTSKFSIAKNKAMYLDFDELNGERDIYIPIYYKKINYPINYSTLKN